LLSSSPSLPLCPFISTSTTAISTLSLHDALPISWFHTAEDWPHPEFDARAGSSGFFEQAPVDFARAHHLRIHHEFAHLPLHGKRSEEHTSELQSRGHLVCRLLLEKKKKIKRTT